MKLGILITSFRNKKEIKEIIKQYEGIADRIVVTVSEKAWFGDFYDNGTTKEAEETSATVHEFYWALEHEQRNWAMDHLRDMDYVIVSHTDTYFTREDLNKLKKMKLTDLHYTCNVKTYWRDLETVIDPDLSLPTMIVRSDAVFTNLINIQDQEVEPKKLPITCYHLSWVGPKQRIKEKIMSYSHANEIPIDWIEKIWNNKNVSTNLAPTNPKDYQGLRKDPLPKEIRKRIKKKEPKHLYDPIFQT